MGVTQGEPHPLNQPTKEREIMDYRLTENRMEYFTTLYAYNLRHGIMPGLVYRYLPQLYSHFGWNGEQKLWFAFLNGMTQNPITSLRMFKQLPSPEHGPNLEQFDRWFNDNWENLQFDTDRRYQKKDTVAAIDHYSLTVEDQFGGNACAMYPTTASYKDTWKVANDLYSFGRLSTFSYLEYVKIMGFGTDCDDLMLKDKSGSKSHRNGTLFLHGQDHIVHDKRIDNGFDGQYEEFPKMCNWLEAQMHNFLKGFYNKYPKLLLYGMGNFSLESNLCTFKNHFFGRRYPGVYADMAYERILKAEATGADKSVTDLFRQLYETLPDGLRIDGVDLKNNLTINQKGAYFVDTGQPYRMEMLMETDSLCKI